MANKPFVAINTSIFDESTTTTSPGVIGTNSVLITQGQQRRVLDTVTTSIYGNPTSSYQTGMNWIQNQQNCCPPCLQQNTLQANAQFIPGGVIFTFGPQQVQSQYTAVPGFAQPQQTPFIQNPLSEYCQQDFTLQQLIAMKELQKHGLETLLLQEQLKKNPFVLQFHQDKRTSTSDLIKAVSMGQPDFGAAAASAANNCITNSPVHSSSDMLYNKAKQLRLPENHKDKQPPPDHITTTEERNTMTDEKGDRDNKVTTEQVDGNNEKTKEETLTQNDANTETDCCCENEQNNEDSCGCKDDSNVDNNVL